MERNRGLITELRLYLGQLCLELAFKFYPEPECLKMGQWLVPFLKEVVNDTPVPLSGPVSAIQVEYLNAQGLVITSGPSDHRYTKGDMIMRNGTGFLVTDTFDSPGRQRVTVRAAAKLQQAVQ